MLALKFRIFTRNDSSFTVHVFIRTANATVSTSDRTLGQVILHAPSRKGEKKGSTTPLHVKRNDKNGGNNHLNLESEERDNRLAKEQRILSFVQMYII